MILLAKSQTASRAYRVGLGLAALTAFVTVWTTIVRDDGQGAASFMVILAAAVGALAVRMEAAGMARAMVPGRIDHSRMPTTNPILANNTNICTNLHVFQSNTSTFH